MQTDLDKQRQTKSARIVKLYPGLMISGKNIW